MASHIASKDRGAIGLSKAFSLAHLFDGVEVGAVGREIQQVHSGIFKALADARDLVGRQVVDDDDAPRLHLGYEAFFEPLLEDHSRHWAREKQWG